MKKKIAVFLLCFCFAGLTGCYTADSGDYSTDRIHCQFAADVSETVVIATASFWTPGAQPANPTYLVLTANDTVTVNGAAMQRRRGPLFDYYTATLQPAEEYIFTFARDDGTSYDSIAPDLLPLTVTSPTPGAWISRDDDLDVTWTNPIEDGDVTVFIPSGQYLNGFLGVTEDVGSYTIPAGTLTLDEMSPQSDVQAQVSVSRRRPGVMAEGLNGNIVTRTEDAVQFVSTEFMHRQYDCTAP